MTVKSKLLGVLEQQKGKVLSGEKLAEELNCTRAAIWKAVKSLREEGYIIEAGPNKGYMLVEDCHHLSQEAIQPFLFTPEVYMEVCQQVDSTNRAAKEAAVTGKAHHAVLYWQPARVQAEDAGVGSFIHRKNQAFISA